MIELEQFLCDLDFDQLQVAIWKQFIIAVIGAMRVAEARLCDPVEWKRFKKMDGALSKAVPRSQRSAQKQPRPLEEGISTELRHYLKDIVRAADENHALKRLQIYFESEAPVRLPNRTGIGARS